ncbi:hypothetical protein U1708_07810 [Sphingomonas sp. ZB1N12]|uniref:hypothetical protein n=1 Tax=Sphingomonas arabinosi TaxID=3096160 RepID=UPI002FCB35C9
MEVLGNYANDGYALISELLSPSILNALLADIKSETAPKTIPISQEDVFAPILNRAAFEVYGPYYTPMKFLQWGMTPVMERLVGKSLEPSYDFFRLYRTGDVCKVHSDRPACEHSMTLTLGYSDGIEWPFHVGHEAIAAPCPITDDFGGKSFATLLMRPGDAVIYKGVEARHGRVDPNPNAWSAHIFLHWVERDGRHAGSAFECGSATSPVDFSFV